MNIPSGILTLFIYRAIRNSRIPGMMMLKAFALLYYALLQLALAALRFFAGIRINRVTPPAPVKIVPRSKHSGRPLRSTLDHAKDLQ